MLSHQRAVEIKFYCQDDLYSYYSWVKVNFRDSQNSMLERKKKFDYIAVGEVVKKPKNE